MELAGVEPASKHGDHTLSTCLFLLVFRDLSAAEQPNKSLVPVFLVFRPEQSSDQPRIPCASLSGWIRAWPPGRRPVPAPVPGLSLSYLIRLSSESVIWFASYCFVTLFKERVTTSCMLTYHPSCCQNQVSPRSEKPAFFSFPCSLLTVSTVKAPEKVSFLNYFAKIQIMLTI